ncbi:hypothetical protein M2175_008038 [Bradyrhizobium elkanii]|nr:hypothetical protein [Bradyrhizobium elkanii]MCS3973564.1 hypothetical protein [Bradyrhizobium japonicum]
MLTNDDLAVLDPGGRHSLRYLVSQARKTFEHRTPALLGRHRLEFFLDEQVCALDEFLPLAGQWEARASSISDTSEIASAEFITKSSARRARSSSASRALARPSFTAADRSNRRLSAISDLRAVGSASKSATRSENGEGSMPIRQDTRPPEIMPAPTRSKVSAPLCNPTWSVPVS